ncbi:MAG: TolC family protein [Leptospiraceae bacterium]|nr:TolC family protein [Leptospiraceae bacterium]
MKYFSYNVLLLLIIFISLLENGSLLPNELPLKIMLKDAEEIAVTNSLVLKSLKDRREIFQKMATEKWRNYLPRLSLGYFGLKNLNENQADSRFNDIRLQLNQLVYDGGETELEIESIKLQEIINSQDWIISRNKTLLESRKAYIENLMNKDKVLLFSELLRKTLSQINETRSEFEQGFVNQSTNFESESKIRELELFLIKTEGNNEQSEINLKKVLHFPLSTNLDLQESLLLDFVLYPPDFNKMNNSTEVANRPELKKLKVSIENLKNRKELAENYWKPKLSLGGYYGKNVNGALPVENEIYGFNINVTTQFGSSTNQTSTNYGVQTDGTGIQRIPGFGPQFVGRGDNAYNSNTLNFFDDLSYSRKILEGKVSLSDALRNRKSLEIDLEAELLKSQSKVKENWQILRISNSKFYLALEAWKTAVEKYKAGFLKKSEFYSAEYELIKAIDELTSATGFYLTSIMDLGFSAGIDPLELKLYEYKKGRGNSVLANFFRNQIRLNTKQVDDSIQQNFSEELEEYNNTN